MNPIDLVAWAWWGGISLLILTIPVTVFITAVNIARGKL